MKAVKQPAPEAFADAATQPDHDIPRAILSLEQMCNPPDGEDSQGEAVEFRHLV